jgi:hypothetical protein
MIKPCHTAKELIAWFEEQEDKELITWEELPGVTVVPGTGPEITTQGRWTTYYRVVLRMGDGSLVEAQWGEGSTEYQDQEPNLMLFEVEAKEEVVVRFARVKS